MVILRQHVSYRTADTCHRHLLQSSQRTCDCCPSGSCCMPQLACVNVCRLTDSAACLAAEAADAGEAVAVAPGGGGGRMIGRYGARLRFAIRLSTARSRRGTPSRDACRVRICIRFNLGHLNVCVWHQIAIPNANWPHSAETPAVARNDVQPKRCCVKFDQGTRL